jgi:hypothetical protein
MPALSPNPPPFTPYGRYTTERKELFDKNNAGFLLPAERDLLHSVLGSGSVRFSAPKMGNRQP